LNRHFAKVQINYNAEPNWTSEQENTAMSNVAKLALEDGTVLTGQPFGAVGEVEGEVCFNTSMTGYQEVLTDPSYHGQIVVMTYPQIGNYGINAEDLENAAPRLSGFVVREASRLVSNYRAEGSLREYLAYHHIVGMEGIDTRALVRRLRIRGAMRGVLSTVERDDRRLVEKAQASPGLVGRDLVREIVPQAPVSWARPLHPYARLMAAGGCRTFHDTERTLPPDAPHVVALDYGMKWNIARHLFDSGCRVTILPGTASAEEVLALRPDGVFLSNGPGDPEPLAYAQQTIYELLGKQPIFGICLGHQLLALACGAKTYKLKFGHRGANQPVLNMESGRVEITSQNHGFAVAADSLPNHLEVTHLNLNDNTIEGLRHRRFPAFCVQYHPEASPGPHDSNYLFHQFRQMLC
jgi:carbamoyl-phosphate synthase small subunit